MINNSIKVYLSRSLLRFVNTNDYFDYSGKDFDIFKVELEYLNSYNGDNIDVIESIDMDIAWKLEWLWINDKCQYYNLCLSKLDYMLSDLRLSVRNFFTNPFVLFRYNDLFEHDEEIREEQKEFFKEVKRNISYPNIDGYSGTQYLYVDNHVVPVGDFEKEYLSVCDRLYGELPHRFSLYGENYTKVSDSGLTELSFFDKKEVTIIKSSPLNLNNTTLRFGKKGYVIKPNSLYDFKIEIFKQNNLEEFIIFDNFYYFDSIFRLISFTVDINSNRDEQIRIINEMLSAEDLNSFYSKYYNGTFRIDKEPLYPVEVNRVNLVREIIKYLNPSVYEIEEPIKFILIKYFSEFSGVSKRGGEVSISKFTKDEIDILKSHNRCSIYDGKIICGYNEFVKDLIFQVVYCKRSLRGEQLNRILQEYSWVGPIKSFN